MNNFGIVVQVIGPVVDIEFHLDGCEYLWRDNDR